MYYLNTERLQVELADPAELLPLTTRFDPTGFISEVILDKSVRFCASEPRNMKSPSSGGRGLCSEFRFDPSGDVQVGEYFPKLGIGLLKKAAEEQFCFYRKYEYIPFEHTVEQNGETEIVFRTLPLPCLGYAAESVRRVTVEENRILMEMRLYNVGERGFTIREYCHNFISLDGMALGPDYSLTLPGGLHMDQRVLLRPQGAELFGINGHTVRPRHGSFTSASFNLEAGDIRDETPFTWRLRHDSADITVEGTEFYRPVEMTIWANDHMLCPEVNFQGSLLPGQSCQWKRQWEFHQVSRRGELS